MATTHETDSPAGKRHAAELYVPVQRRRRFDDEMNSRCMTTNVEASSESFQRQPEQFERTVSEHQNGQYDWRATDNRDWNSDKRASNRKRGQTQDNEPPCNTRQYYRPQQPLAAYQEHESSRPYHGNRRANVNNTTNAGNQAAFEYSSRHFDAHGHDSWVPCCTDQYTECQDGEAYPASCHGPPPQHQHQRPNDASHNMQYRQHYGHDSSNWSQDEHQFPNYCNNGLQSNRRRQWQQPNGDEHHSHRDSQPYIQQQREQHRGHQQRPSDTDTRGGYRGETRHPRPTRRGENPKWQDTQHQSWDDRQARRQPDHESQVDERRHNTRQFRDSDEAGGAAREHHREREPRHSRPTRRGEPTNADLESGRNERHSNQEQQGHRNHRNHEHGHSGGYSHPHESEKRFDRSSRPHRQRGEHSHTKHDQKTRGHDQRATQLNGPSSRNNRPCEQAPLDPNAMSTWDRNSYADDDAVMLPFLPHLKYNINDYPDVLPLINTVTDNTLPHEQPQPTWPCMELKGCTCPLCDSTSPFPSTKTALKHYATHGFLFFQLSPELQQQLQTVAHLICDKGTEQWSPGRSTAQFEYAYNTNNRTVWTTRRLASEPVIQDQLEDLCEKLGLPPPWQVLLNSYQAGACIAWHKDAGSLGDFVVSISVTGKATMWMGDSKQGVKREPHVDLVPGSVVIFGNHIRHKVESSTPRLGLTLRWRNFHFQGNSPFSHSSVIQSAANLVCHSGCVQ